MHVERRWRLPELWKETLSESGEGLFVAGNGEMGKWRNGERGRGFFLGEADCSEKHLGPQFITSTLFEVASEV